MTKNRLWLSLAMVILVFAVGLFTGRSQAQPEKTQQPGPPIFLKIGKLRINPNQIARAYTYNNNVGEPDKYLAVSISGGSAGVDYYDLGQDGVAEASLEWIDAHSTELKPKVVNKK
jgi:hypothetical protein